MRSGQTESRWGRQRLCEIGVVVLRGCRACRWWDVCGVWMIGDITESEESRVEEHQASEHEEENAESRQPGADLCSGQTAASGQPSEVSSAECSV